MRRILLIGWQDTPPMYARWQLITANHRSHRRKVYDKTLHASCLLLSVCLGFASQHPRIRRTSDMRVEAQERRVLLLPLKGERCQRYGSAMHERDMRCNTSSFDWPKTTIYFFTLRVSYVCCQSYQMHPNPTNFGLEPSWSNISMEK